MQLRVSVRLLSTTEGGRKTPAWSKYRPDWSDSPVINPPFAGFYCCGQIAFDKSPLMPGEETTGIITPLVEANWAHIKAGDVIFAYEGSRQVARAVIESIV